MGLSGTHPLGRGPSPPSQGLPAAALFDELEEEARTASNPQPAKTLQEIKPHADVTREYWIKSLKDAQGNPVPQTIAEIRIGRDYVDVKQRIPSWLNVR